MPVLQIPFDVSGEVVESDLRREVDFCIATGSHAVVVPALASEFMVLTDDERRRVVEIAIDAAAGRVPVVAGVSATSERGVRVFARHAEEKGAAAVIALPPYVRRPGPEGTISYYRAIAAATNLPIVLQNAPPPFAAGIGIELMLRLLAEVPSVLYVKEERPPAGHHISALLAAAGSRLLGVFGGAAGLYLMGELTRRATGCMPSAAVPDVLVAVVRDFAAGRVEAARTRYNRILPLLILEMQVQMAVSKEVLRRRKVFTHGGMRDPEFPPLDAGDLTELDAIWAASEGVFTVREPPQAGNSDSRHSIRPDTFRNSAQQGRGT